MNDEPRSIATCGAGQHLEAIFHSVSDGIFALNEALEVTRANRAALDLTGLDERDLLGRPFLEVFPGRPDRDGGALGEALQTTPSLQDERVVVLTRSGRRRLVLLSTSPLHDSEGGRSGLVVVFRDVTELETLREELKGRYRFHRLLAKSRPMQDVFRLIEQASRSEATVVIEGESGTGKELVARAIHYHGPRAAGPFVPVHCAALAEGVLESELFGHVKGAFTGAISDKIGRFEAAAGGTLFLDELAEISPLIQLKLLRVIQEREVWRVGAGQPVKVDVRIVAATNKNLREQTRQGAFREDLYYRLRVVAIALPPLRERREDIPLLVHHFIERFRERTQKPIAGCAEPVLRLFLTYPWPGNVRELENAIERAFVVAQGRTITLDDLPPELLEDDVGQAVQRRRELRSSEAPAERDILLQALTEAGWNKAKAARRLGIARNTLYAKLKRYGLRQG